MQSVSLSRKFLLIHASAVFSTIGLFPLAGIHSLRAAPPQFIPLTGSSEPTVVDTSVERTQSVSDEEQRSREVPQTVPASQKFDRENADLEVAFEPEASVPASSLETVRERFPNGRLRIERQVMLDANGNYVNHGDYAEWNQAGEIVSTGRFVLGKRDGAWIKTCRPADAAMFKAYPFSGFKPPFQSTAEFIGGHLHGVWTITDADHRTISEIKLSAGVRDGRSVWYHPNGSLMYEATYVGGILHGPFIERDINGTTVRDQQFIHGQRSESEREFFANKSIKGEFQYLSPPQNLVSNDDWNSNQPAKYETTGKRVKHGPFTTWHPNGQVKAKGNYTNGVLDGNYQSWHDNGQRDAQGEYQMGSQHGSWVWWHPNGMRRSTGVYHEGKPVGEWLAWNADGQRITEGNVTAVRALGTTTPIGSPLEVRPSTHPKRLAPTSRLNQAAQWRR